MPLRVFNNVSPRMSSSTYVDDMALIIGDVKIGEDSSVWPMTVVRGDVHHIRIGKRTNIQDGSILHVTHYGEYNSDGFPLTVGDEVTVGHGVVLHACTVGHRCLIGMHSTLLDGVIIENDVMIGAHSLVSPGKKLESGYLYVGTPIKQIRKLTSKEVQFLKYSAEHYVKLKNQHMEEA